MCWIMNERSRSVVECTASPAGNRLGPSFVFWEQIPLLICYRPGFQLRSYLSGLKGSKSLLGGGKAGVEGLEGCRPGVGLASGRVA